MKQKNIKKRMQINRQQKKGEKRKRRQEKKHQTRPAERYIKQVAMESFLRLLGLENISIPYYIKQGFIEVGPFNTYRLTQTGQIFFENFINKRLNAIAE